MHEVKTQPRILLVHPEFAGKSSALDSDDSIQEAGAICAALDYLVVDRLIFRIANPHPNSLFGSGQVSTIAEHTRQLAPNLVIVNHPLTPVQQRHLEKNLQVDIVDRNKLILTIFAAHARSYEGRLQVELATLNYQRNRLQRSWQHLERQRGGIGFTAGPGERQIELDRRQIAQRIHRIEQKLHQVTRTRELHRKARQRFPYPLVALVGYTNAGKSTLFNRLTSAGVKVQNIPFTTLDPSMRICKLPSGSPIILSDTVGFIANLPTTLIAAFRATLEEVCQADLLLHVRDISHHNSSRQLEKVTETLVDLDLNGTCLEVWNKCDLLDQWPNPVDEVAVSARANLGINDLLQKIEHSLSIGKNTVSYLIPAANGAALAWLHRHGQRLQRCDNDDGAVVSCSLAPEQQQLFEQRFHLRAS